MISLTCTHCSATLTMDDAFAGGVCRCQHCGTIQTVPAKDAGNGGKGASAPSAQQQKALYQRRGRAASADQAGSGLDELADIVASSGLSNLSNKVNRPATIARAPEPDAGTRGDRRNLTPLLVGGGAAIAVILGLIAWLIVSGNRNAGARDVATGGTSSANTAGGAPAAAAKPSFLNIPLDGNNVIYVVDNGQSAEELFGLMKDAVLRSAESLGTGRKFQIVFWDNGTGELKVTPAIPSTPGERTLEHVRKTIEDVIPQGQSNAEPALRRAFSASPTDVVVITAKGRQMDESFGTAAENIRKAKPGAKIHTVSLGADAESDVLRRVAVTSGGRHITVTPDELEAFAS